MIEGGELVPAREFLSVARQIRRSNGRVPLHPTKHLGLPRPFELAHQSTHEGMELVSVAATGRDLDVLLVDHQQRAMKLGAGVVIDPRRGAPVGGAIRGVRGVAKIPGDGDQPFLEADISIEPGVEVGRIEQDGQGIGERLRWRRLARRAPDQGDGG